MHVIECIRLAFRNIGVNKLRSTLTMLGIIIGISAVITITTIGNSLKLTISRTMSDLGGAGLIFGYLDVAMPDDVDFDTFEWPELTEDDMISDELLAAYKEAFSDEVSTILLEEYYSGGKVELPDSYANCNVIGVSGNSLSYQKLEILSGRDISDRDNEELKYTAVVSDVFARNLFGEENPIGKQIDVPINDISHTFTIVGVYEYNARIAGDFDSGTPEKDRSTSLYVPFQAAKHLFGQAGGYSNLNIMAKPDVDTTELSEKTMDYFNDYYSKHNPSWQFECFNMASELGLINTVVDVVTIAIAIIASISLIVGGVGVMNIMLVSIVERTKEIGIRKALGARNSSIRAQFLTEAIIICLIGGILGILIGMLNGFLLAKVGGFLLESSFSEYSGLLAITIRPSLSAITVSVLFSMAIGMIFGYYPANRAAKLNPITALGYE